MEVLILSCGTGGGHDAAGHAVEEAMLRRGHRVTMFNPYTLKSDKLARTIDWGYIKIAQKAPWLFGLIYRVGSLYRRLPWRSPLYHINKAMGPRLEAYLKAHPCDVILMPHPFPGEILTGLKDRGVQVPPMIYISTDYTCIPFSEELKCDAYVIPARELKEEFVRFGLPEERLYPLGIPVSARFSQPVTRAEARQALGLEQDKHYVLISGGSIGAGQIWQIVHSLHKRSKADDRRGAVVICGNHRSLYERMRAHYGDRIRILERTDRMDLYMKACDVFISKPGGLSSTEAAVTGIPLLHMKPIPGCETCNLRYFGRLGMSLGVKGTGKALFSCLAQAEDPERRQKMLENQRRHSNPHAAEDICDLAEALAGEKTAEREAKRA